MQYMFPLFIRIESWYQTLGIDKILFDCLCGGLIEQNNCAFKNVKYWAPAATISFNLEKHLTNIKF